MKFQSSSPCGLCCTRIAGLNVSYGIEKILSEINLHVHCGELTVIIGPNGGGKTTLLKAILGEIPFEGELRFLDPKQESNRKPSIGYVPQKMEFDSDAPFCVIDLFASAMSSRPAWLGVSDNIRQRALSALERVKISHLLDRRIGTLSGGELQRALLALAIEPLPTLLLLDEPMAHVDRNGMELFYEIVTNLKHTQDLSILLVSHDLPLAARYADRIVLLDNKILAVGSPADVFGNTKTIEFFGKIEVPEYNSIKSFKYIDGEIHA